STFSILISFQAIQKRYHPNNNYYLANILINAVFIVLIASKIAVVSIFILLLIRQFYGQRKVWKIAIAIGATVIVAGLFFIIKNEQSVQFNQETQKQPPSFIEKSMT